MVIHICSFPPFILTLQQKDMVTPFLSLAPQLLRESQHWLHGPVPHVPWCPGCPGSSPPLALLTLCSLSPLLSTCGNLFLARLPPNTGPLHMPPRHAPLSACLLPYLIKSYTHSGFQRKHLSCRKPSMPGIHSMAPPGQWRGKCSLIPYPSSQPGPAAASRPRLLNWVGVDLCGIEAAHSCGFCTT